jgi:hypothetical protein
MTRLICVLLFSLLAGALFSCKKEDARLHCVEGTVLGPGCLPGSYAIRVQGKNRDYGIHENLQYDDMVETFNLPEMYQTSGTKVYFTFSERIDETAKYLTYCNSAPQITIIAISSLHCPVREDHSY